MTDQAIVERSDDGFQPIKDNAARQAASLSPSGAGGAEPGNLAQQVDYAKYMAEASFAVPKHLRGNRGACIAVMDMAKVWGFSPYHLARMSYVVNDMLSYQAQLILAVIEKFAPLQKRLRWRFEGEGDDRVCIVSALFKGEVEPMEYRSPRRGDIKPKNSPLWQTDPDQQQSYLSASRWARLYCNAIIMGVHTKEELEDAFGTEHVGFERAKDVSPLVSRLTGTGSLEGFPGSAAVDAALAAARDHEIEKSPSAVGKRRASSAAETAVADESESPAAAEEAPASLPRHPAGASTNSAQPPKARRCPKPGSG